MDHQTYGSFCFLLTVQEKKKGKRSYPAIHNSLHSLSSLPHITFSSFSFITFLSSSNPNQQSLSSLSSFPHITFFSFSFITLLSFSNPNQQSLPSLSLSGLFQSSSRVWWPIRFFVFLSIRASFLTQKMQPTPEMGRFP